MKTHRLFAVLGGALLLGLAVCHARAEGEPGLDAVIDGPQRSPALKARDQYRHPYEELTFFGLKPKMTVVEIWPSGGYWTEILAPYLKGHGTYYAATPGGDQLSPEAKSSNEKFKAKLGGDPDIYGKVQVTSFWGDQFPIAPAGTADMVVTFRNLHNWMAQGTADAAIHEFFVALKPGGVLGIEDHRGRNDQPQDPQAKSGYVREDYAIALIEKAGFRLEGKSEINSNPMDTKDYPAGVWTLPPTLRLGEQDKDKYLSIGEADNFVLRFKKPE